MGHGPSCIGKETGWISVLFPICRIQIPVVVFYSSMKVVLLVYKYTLVSEKVPIDYATGDGKVSRSFNESPPKKSKRVSFCLYHT